MSSHSLLCDGIETRSFSGTDSLFCLALLREFALKGSSHKLENLSFVRLYLLVGVLSSTVTLLQRQLLSSVCPTLDVSSSTTC